MDLTTLLDRLGFVLDNNDGQVNQAFSTARKTQALNYAYRDEMRQAQLECGRQWLKTTTEITWPADQQLLALPSGLDQRLIVLVRDVTNDADQAINLAWRDHKTLVWGDDGPGDAKTLRVVFYPNPVDLVAGVDEPELLPDLYHDLIVWSAAVFLLDVADQAAPGSWVRNQESMRLDLHKFLSQGRPLSAPNTVVNSDPDMDDGSDDAGGVAGPGGGLTNVA